MPANTGAAGATVRYFFICANAGEPGINMLVNAVHHVQMTKALAELLLHRQTGDITRH